MDWFGVMLGVAALIGALSMGALVVRSPDFWFELGKRVFIELLPRLLKVFGPKDLTPEQKDKIARGEDPQLAGTKRPFGRNKGE